MINDNNREHCKLTDIINGDTAKLKSQWDATEAAQDFAPLPSGKYIAHLHKVELFNARTGTPGVKLQFRIAEGEYIGRMLFDDLWLTAAALPQTKRDCLKLGLDSLDKLESANIEPGRIRCRVRVALRTSDNGEQRNHVRSFDVLGVDELESDPFAPDESGDTATTTEAASSPLPLADDTSFDVDQLESESAADAPTASGGLPGVKTDDIRWASAR